MKSSGRKCHRGAGTGGWGCWVKGGGPAEATGRMGRPGEPHKEAKRFVILRKGGRPSMQSASGHE